MSDLNRNLLLLNQLYWQAGRKSDAQRVLLDALKLGESHRIYQSFCHRRRSDGATTAPADSTQYAAGTGTASRTAYSARNQSTSSA
ncbi:hypothetical protein ACLB1R_24105 [Escherichia coli]